MDERKETTSVRTSKNLSAKQIALVVAASCIIFIAIVAIASALTSNPNPTAKSRLEMTSPRTATAKPKTPAMSLAALKTQETPALTTATNYLVNLYTKVQSDATQPNTTGINGALNQDKNTFVTTPDNTVHTAYNAASNAYYDANQDQPAALDNWNSDAEQLYTDISGWAMSEDNYLVDQLFNTPTASDKAAANAARQAYNSDLTKVQADITALPN